MHSPGLIASLPHYMNQYNTLRRLGVFWITNLICASVKHVHIFSVGFLFSRLLIYFPNQVTHISNATIEQFALTQFVCKTTSKSELWFTLTKFLTNIPPFSRSCPSCCCSLIRRFYCGVSCFICISEEKISFLLKSE